MGVKKLQSIPSLPNFNLPEPYNSDFWDIKNWDYYLSSSEENRYEWDQRGNTKSDYIDFTICKNTFIREEIKYYMFFLIEESKVNIATLGRRWQECKTIIRFSNAYLNDYYSICDFSDWKLFERFITEEEPIPKKMLNNSTATLNSQIEKKRKKVNSPVVRMLNQIIKIVNDYNDDRPELEKDIWRVDRLPYNIRNSKIAPIKTINFSRINQEQMKTAIKEYVKLRLNNVSLTTISLTVTILTHFSNWLEENYPEIDSFCSLNRTIMEDYIIWVKVSSGWKAEKAATYLGHINTVFDYLRLAKQPLVPRQKIICIQDYKTKVHREPKPYSDAEIKTINQHLSYLDDLQYARIVYLLQATGCRLSEIMLLKPDQLFKNGELYQLKVIRGKNNKVHRIPIDKVTAGIILQAYEESKKRYGDDVVYVFAKGITENMYRGELVDHLRNLSYDYELKDDLGKPLNITLKRFRTTLSCKLLEEGLDANIISLLLGHKVKGTLKHYAAVSNKKLKEAMKPRLEKYDLLIANIGNVKNLSIPTTNHSGQIPLPNGYCSKSITTGVCENANACLGCSMFCPDEKYLLGYKLQLAEVERAITDAEEKGNERLLEIHQKTRAELISIIEKMEGTSNE